MAIPLINSSKNASLWWEVVSTVCVALGLLLNADRWVSIEYRENDIINVLFPRCESLCYGHKTSTPKVYVFIPLKKGLQNIIKKNKRLNVKGYEPWQSKDLIEHWTTINFHILEIAEQNVEMNIILNKVAPS